MNLESKENIVAVGCDHGGYELAGVIEAHLRDAGYTVLHFGSTDGSPIDYPAVAIDVCRQITGGNVKYGILICGTGIGMSLAANKVKGIRAAACSETFSARYTRMHNDANVLCLGGRVIGPGVALEMVDLFLNTPFEGGRHKRRVDAVTDIENEGI